MPLDFVLAGSTAMLRRALANVSSWRDARMLGVAAIGPGDVGDIPIIARAASWREFDFAELAGEIVLAGAPPPADLREILKAASEQGRRLRIVADGRVRALSVDDLVYRPAADIDWRRVSESIAGKRVLITGAGGSIGSELARKVAALSPARLSLLDSSEFNLFRIAGELTYGAPILADIRDADSIRRWMRRERPDLVFHAAALKQVPMAEHFPGESVLTNVCGVRNVAEATREVEADLLLVSTDKAVDPTGVMGATKRLGELYCRALDLRGPRRAIAVRLGNVIGSAGSVAPLFASQIAAGGPVTVTDPRATRYFISIPQAAEMLLQAAAVALAPGAARGQAMALDMGEAMLVMDLARDMIRLAGLRPHADVDIRVTGLRPGERLHEFFVGSDEWLAPRPAAGVDAIDAPPPSFSALQEVMDRLAMLARRGADAEIVGELFEAVGSRQIATEKSAAL